MKDLVQTPQGKTTVMIVRGGISQSKLKEFDIGYIDGYVQGADNRPYCVFVRHSDGFIDLCPNHQLQAVKDEPITE